VKFKLSIETAGKAGFYSARFFTAKVVGVCEFLSVSNRLKTCLSHDRAQGPYLNYFKNENVAGSSDYCLAAVDLKLVDITEPEAEGSGRVFKIVFPDDEGEMSLRAETREDATSWVKSLKKLKEKSLSSSGDAPPFVSEGASSAVSESGSMAGEGGGAGNEDEEDEDEEEYMVHQARRGSVFIVEEQGQQVLSTRVLNRKAEKRAKGKANKELLPKKGTVNEVSMEALDTTVAGNERKVRQRRSLTGRACFSPGCAVFHMRDSPYCHDHAILDPSSVKVYTRS
jgi:hypothetical protein